MANVLPGHEQTLREHISRGQGTPVMSEVAKEIGTLHEFRWVLFDNDHRILFASSFDGTWDKYIEDFASSAVGEGINQNLQHVEGWVGITDPRAGDWLLEHAVPPVGYFVSFPQSVKEIEKALAVQQAFQKVLDSPGAEQALANPVLKPLLDQAST